MKSVASFFLSLFPFIVFANNNYSPDVPEPGSIEAIKKETTEMRYMSTWVSYVPESKTVPSPADYLGHIAGAAGKLTSSRQIYGYLRELDRATDRVHVEVIGKTEEGREILLVAIADEAGIRDLEKLKSSSAALADPRKTTPEQAEQIIRSARPFYFLNAAIHADESISPDMAMELAYRLAVSEQPMIRNIREKMVVLINPVSNPDGRDKLSEWFYQHIQGKTDYDTLPRQSPPYWGKYVYVDANRDAHQLAFGATQAVARAFFEYHPIVIHDLHEAIALLQTWNGTGPYNPHLDPIVLSEFLEMSFHEMSAMNAQGMPGVWTWDFGEGFGHHYMDSIAMNHNAIGRGYETFGNAVPLTITRKLEPHELTREWYRPSPPPEKTFLWSHRNGLNYAQTGCLAILDYTARHADSLLRNFYQKGFNSWQKGRAGNPYAFVIRIQQRDRRRAAAMVNRLRKQGIEVHRATADFSVREGSFQQGSFIVLLDQPYRNYAVDLLLPQEFPADTELIPYDDVSWALPVNFNVDTIRINDAAIRNAPVQLITEDVHLPGSVRGSGSVFLLKDTGQEALLAARYRLSDFQVQIAQQPFSVSGETYPAGSWIIKEQNGLRSALDQISRELSLDFAAIGSVPDVATHDAVLPRIGIWVPWADTDMIGWIRYILDRDQVPYTYVRDEDIRTGSLNSKVDVIVYGNVLMDVEGQIHGIAKSGAPLAFKKTAQTPALGTPAESDDITGGIGYEGLANLLKFVEEGGLFISLGSGSNLVLETGFVRSVKRADLDDFRTPGTHIAAKFVQPEHPVAYGYPVETYAFRSNYPAYDPPRTWLTMSYCTSCLTGPFDFKNMVLQWGSTGFQSGEDTHRPIVVSGGAKNAEALEGRPAILDVPVGKGAVLVFNFNPMHRDMNRADHRYLWNGILNWKYITTKTQTHRVAYR